MRQSKTNHHTSCRGRESSIWARFPTGRFPQLLGNPGICRIPGKSGMDDLPRLQFDDDEEVKWSQQQIMNGDEIAGPDVAGMVLEEGGPGLTKAAASLWHVSLDRPFADPDAQLEKFAANVFCAPQTVLAAHLLDEVDGFLRDTQFPLPFSRFASPVQAKQVPMPT